MKRQLFLLILYVFPLLSFGSEGEDLLFSSHKQFEHFSIADGLSQNNVTCMLQDSRGFLWIGTQAGLNCYTGTSFEIFKNDPEDRNSISDNMIYDIAEDADGNIWVATENGLNKFDRESYSFVSYFSYSASQSIVLSDNTVYAVECDNEQSLWIITPNYINRINFDTGIVKKYQYEKDLFSKEVENYSFSIYQDSYGVLWFGTREGLAYYEPKIDDLVFFRHDAVEPHSISNNNIRCIFEDDYSNLWIGTQNGLNKLDRKSKTFFRYYYSQKEKKENAITGICHGKNNTNLWITTNKDGMFHFSPLNNQFTQYTYSAKNNSIATNNINCILKDRSEIVWIGTRNGLNKLDVKPQKFYFFDIYHNKTDDLFSQHVTAIYKLRNYVFIGTRFNGLYIYNTETSESFHFSDQIDGGDFSENHITSICKALHENEVFVAGENSLQLFNIETFSFSDFEVPKDNFNQFFVGNKVIKTVFVDTRKNVWIGTNSGIYVWFSDDNKITHYNKYSNTRFLPSNIIYKFYEDSRGIIWIGTDNGLARYIPEKDAIKPFKYSSNTHRNINQHKVYAIIEDAYNKIWIGTNSGLYVFREADSSYTFYTEKDGLPNNQIFGLIQYKKDIWISTNKGLAKYNGIRDKFTSFDPSDGIQGYEFSPNSIFKTKENVLFFGGTQGVNIFHPDSIYKNSITPNLEFLHISYYENKHKKTVYLFDDKEITLPWNHNFLNIHFAALEFTQPEKNQYKYILENLDDEWHDLGNQHVINYTSLPSGTYTLKIIGSNNDGVWGRERILKVIVETPFWKTIWAFVIYVVLFAILLYLFIESRTKKLRAANKILVEQQKSALEISKQKEQLSLKNKNITDSITYAKRIQWAIMPSRAKFKQLLPNSFIFYMPKDIVSGDFYWITEIQDKIFIAAVDCTGHGVPGAFMSIIGYDLLRNITKERKIHKPSEILDYLNKALIELLTKNQMEDDTTVKDGMDLSICVLHKHKGILEYAGAYNPLYIVRNNKIISIKGDRFSVGLGNEHEDIPFKNHIVKVQPGDTFYIFSDGYVDQFGGPKRKKMKYLRFRHLLLSIHNLPFMKQNRQLKEFLLNWKGDLEQVDDILIIGFNVDNYVKSIQKNVKKNSKKVAENESN
ncbi:MAG: two-component regulator propeller domain-containing protein [Bacteroidales bacterium]